MIPSVDIPSNAKGQKEEESTNNSMNITDTKPPKRPLSAYNYFFKHERARILGIDESSQQEVDGSGEKATSSKKKRRHRKVHGIISFKDMAKQVSQKWKTLSDDEKLPFVEQFQKDRQRYRDEMILYTSYQKELKKQQKKQDRVIAKKRNNDNATATASTPTAAATVSAIPAATGATAPVAAVSAATAAASVSSATQKKKKKKKKHDQSSLTKPNALKPGTISVSKQNVMMSENDKTSERSVILEEMKNDHPMNEFPPENRRITRSLRRRGSLLCDLTLEDLKSGGSLRNIVAQSGSLRNLMTSSSSPQEKKAKRESILSVYRQQQHGDIDNNAAGHENNDFQNNKKRPALLPFLPSSENKKRCTEQAQRNNGDMDIAATASTRPNMPDRKYFPSVATVGQNEVMNKTMMMNETTLKEGKYRSGSVIIREDKLDTEGFLHPPTLLSTATDYFDQFLREMDDNDNDDDDNKEKCNDLEPSVRSVAPTLPIRSVASSSPVTLASAISPIRPSLDALSMNFQQQQQQQQQESNSNNNIVVTPAMGDRKKAGILSSPSTTTPTSTSLEERNIRAQVEEEMKQKIKLQKHQFLSVIRQQQRLILQMQTMILNSYNNQNNNASMSNNTGIKATDNNNNNNMPPIFPDALTSPNGLINHTNSIIDMSNTTDEAHSNSNGHIEVPSPSTTNNTSYADAFAGGV